MATAPVASTTAKTNMTIATLFIPFPPDSFAVSEIGTAEKAAR
jgi:hypothetical protein